MELWEFNSCVKGFNDTRAANEKLSFVRVWETAALTGSAFAGKLKKLGHYTKDSTTEQSGQTLTPQEMDEFDRKYQAQQSEGRPTE